jgi:transcriptional regulator of heat shock response
MTESELREWTLKEAVNSAIEQHNRTIDGSIQRAATIGSSLLGDTRVLTGPWDEEIN